MLRLDFEQVPVFCAHEHWGSIAAYGTDTNGFRADTECGAAPTRGVSLWDIVLDPYFGGFIAGAGTDFHGIAREKGFDDFHAWAKKQPEPALEFIRPALLCQRFTGAYQALRRGILRLYGYDLDKLSAADLPVLNERIAENYSKPIDWICTAARQEKLHPIIRPVHPEFYLQQGPYADDERSAICTLLRIDPLLDLWRTESPRRDALGKAIGIDPRDADSWRAFLSRLFDLAAQNGAVGIKQLQAYHRNLDFTPRRDDEIIWRGADLTKEQVRAFQDWVVLECCRQAEKRGWPFQFHIGTHKLPHSTPLPLERLVRQFPELKIVLLHCWPYVDEAGYLAKMYRNVYIDACWQVVLNPMFLEKSLRAWLGYVPLSRLMFSQDATSVEMAAGTASLVRWILARAIENYATLYTMETTDLEKAGRTLLYENGFAVYGLTNNTPDW